MPDTRIPVDPDAFSSGQISSKIWLCENLEKMEFDRPQVIWIYGGWIGTMSLLLLARDRMPIDRIRSFDIDPECQPIADSLLENWIWQDWKFKAFALDCNELNVTKCLDYGPEPDIIINTSVEHFDSSSWFDLIPSGKLIAMQSNNMNHGDHHSHYTSLEHFVGSFDFGKLIHSGEKRFSYPTWGFSRYMAIGTKA